MVKKLGGEVADGKDIRKEKPVDKLALGEYLNSADETIRKITTDFTPHELLTGWKLLNENPVGFVNNFSDRLLARRFSLAEQERENF